MLRLKSDLLALIEHALDGTLDHVEAEWDRRAALGVVLAAAGYPDEPRKGDVISGLPKGDARTATCSTPARRWTAARSSPTAGACCASPRSATRAIGARARLRSRRAIRFDGMQMRRDIGHRARIRGALKKTSERRGHRTASATTSPRCRRASSRRSRRWTASRSAATAGSAPEGGGGIELHHRGRQAVRARRRELLARVGQRLPPSATASRPQLAGRASRRWACRWCCIRAIPTAPRCT